MTALPAYAQFDADFNRILRSAIILYNDNNPLPQPKIVTIDDNNQYILAYHSNRNNYDEVMRYRTYPLYTTSALMVDGVELPGNMIRSCNLWSTPTLEYIQYNGSNTMERHVAREVLRHR